jgi:hypothetical protein
VGVAVLDQLYDPAVISMFRLAIASAEDAPELAGIMERNAFQPNQRAMSEMMSGAIQAGVLIGEASALAVRFFALLTGGAHVSILLGIAAPPKPRELARHSAEVADQFLRLHGAASSPW